MCIRDSDGGLPPGIFVHRAHVEFRADHADPVPRTDKPRLPAVGDESISPAGLKGARHRLLHQPSFDHRQRAFGLGDLHHLQRHFPADFSPGG